jgi:hypothetical protein
MSFLSQEKITIVEFKVFDKTKIIKANDRIYRAVKNLVEEGLASGMVPGSPELSVAVRVQVESAVMRCLDEAVLKDYDPLSDTSRTKVKQTRLLEEVKFGDKKYTRIDLISKIIEGVAHNLPLDDEIMAKGFYLYLQESQKFYMSIRQKDNFVFVGDTVLIDFFDKKVRLGSVDQLSPDVTEAKSVFPLLVNYINESLDLRDEVIIKPKTKNKTDKKPDFDFL